jgi:hypothetical protein
VVLVTEQAPSVTYDQFLAAFAAYKHAVEESEGFVRDVKTDDRGLLTWSAGTRNGREGLDLVDELYEIHFRDTELSYLRQLRSGSVDNGT